jgi:hypothetical protein
VWPDDLGDQLPSRSAFTHYPKALQDAVIANWPAYGFSRAA